MKKKVGKLFGKSIVVGDANELKEHELLLKKDNKDKVKLYFRDVDGKLEAYTQEGGEGGSSPSIDDISMFSYLQYHKDSLFGADNKRNFKASYVIKLDISDIISTEEIEVVDSKGNILDFKILDGEKISTGYIFTGGNYLIINTDYDYARILVVSDEEFFIRNKNTRDPYVMRCNKTIYYSTGYEGGITYSNSTTSRENFENLVATSSIEDIIENTPPKYRNRLFLYNTRTTLNKYGILNYADNSGYFTDGRGNYVREIYNIKSGQIFSMLND